MKEYDVYGSINIEFSGDSMGKIATANLGKKLKEVVTKHFEELGTFSEDEGEFVQIEFDIDYEEIE